MIILWPHSTLLPEGGHQGLPKVPSYGGRRSIYHRLSKPCSLLGRPKEVKMSLRGNWYESEMREGRKNEKRRERQL